MTDSYVFTNKHSKTWKRNLPYVRQIFTPNKMAQFCARGGGGGGGGEGGRGTPMPDQFGLSMLPDRKKPGPFLA